jgi:hypothetical protein
MDHKDILRTLGALLEERETKRAQLFADRMRDWNLTEEETHKYFYKEEPFQMAHFITDVVMHLGKVGHDVFNCFHDRAFHLPILIRSGLFDLAVMTIEALEKYCNEPG